MDIDQQMEEVNGDSGEKDDAELYSVRILNNGHKLPLTCVCVDSHAKYAYSGSKCGRIVKWCLETNKILKTIVGRSKNEQSVLTIKNHHNRHINCLALSSDDKYLVSGGYDRLIRIWNSEDVSLLHVFKGHQDEVTGLVFRHNSYNLYSSSADKTIKTWLMEEEPWSYVETLFGHESNITSIDALDKERVITSGGRDGTIRIWKIVEESQSVFQSSHKSVDIVKYIDDKHFVSGGEDGNIAVWSIVKRKPLNIIAHNSEIEDVTKIPWVSSIATHTPGKSSITEDSSKGYTIATGSSDGKLNIWKFNSNDTKKTDRLISIPITGVINSLVFTKDGSKLVAAVGQEHRFGRWWRIKGSKNAIYVISLKTTAQN